MKTKFILPGILCIMLSSCMVSEKSPALQKVKTVQRKELQFSPLTNQMEINSKFSIKVQPIDATELNMVLYNSLDRSGKYNQESISERIIYDTKDNNEKKSKNAEMYSDIESGVNGFLTKGEIPLKVADLLLKNAYNELVMNKSMGYDGSEITTDFSFEFLRDNNPFIFDKTYASVFRLTFENNSDKIEQINLTDFFISFGAEGFSVISPSFYFNQNRTNPAFQRQILSFYMPEKLTVLPKTKVVKYITTPPIDTKSNELTCSYIGGTALVACKFSMKTIDSEIKYNFNRYLFEPKKSFDIFYFISTVIITADDVAFPTKNTSIYILDKNENKEISVYSIGYIQGGPVKLGKAVKILPASFPDHEVILDYKR